MEFQELLRLALQDAPLSIVLLIIGLRLISLLENCVRGKDDDK